jgi:hypothetical protein
VTPSPLTPADGQAEGERRRDAALALLADRRAAVIRRGQRALLAALLERGTATADDVRDAVPLPEGIGPRCYGAVPLPLADAGLIRHAGYTATRRPEGRARPIAVWRLADRAAALTWLDAHPELPDPDDDEPQQRNLWD